ncbi:glycosyltransferase involved in cell wall biosynthesis [Nocardioides sp. BE266]|uniref:glycosyltransferase family 4 protein n=1 Tax=Nocardioides sp. BE266 TaxID=2817725 RepID=UPI00286678C6|nr:glycosyltransferase family 4 protein [Nocardioides sp. BE266]MDR7254564.1 glycosyltransferase involved in cell wall biosynthesis [Nocardioides sp. BE266]
MRVAFLSWRDTTHPDGGGSEVFVESVGRELAARGHQVTLLCARHPGSARREERDGVLLRRVGGRLTVYLWGLAWLVRHRRDVDVVVDVVNGLPFASPLVRRHGVVALVHHVHAEQWRIIYPGLAGRIGWFVESRLVPLLYRRRPFLTVSDSSARDLAAIGIAPAAITVVRNGLSAAPPEVVPAEAATPRLVVLSRLVPHKQIEHAFAVLRRLEDDLLGLHLDVVGEGWWHAELVAAAAAEGVTDRVTFHGHVSDARRDELVGRAWLMVMPSVKEGWCLAITESGAQGTPSVAYASAGGVTESIHDGRTGRLVGDLDEMVEAVRELLHDETRRRAMGAAARDLAASLTWEACAIRAERVLREAGAAGDQSP